MKTAQIVLGLGFGDEGKGITTDFLSSQNEDSMVLRFSGGQQAAHTVKIGEKKHIHSSFCSGALRGLPSYFSEHCTFHPSFFEVEKKILEKLNANTSVVLHPLVKITTPFDVWQNRNSKQNIQHGTCGKGVGATMKRHESPFKLYAVDLKLPEKAFLEKLKNIAHFYGLNHEGSLKEELDFFLYSIFENYWKIADYDFLKAENLIFEGSQGILLDMNHGFFPNVTFANTTSKNALEICEKLKIENIETFYVSRSYQTRHGNGWMSSELDLSLKNNEEETCLMNPFQGKFRIGEFDYELINYALNVDQMYNPESSKNLVITCMDQRNFEIDFQKIETAFSKVYFSYSADSKDFQQVR